MTSRSGQMASLLANQQCWARTGADPGRPHYGPGSLKDRCFSFLLTEISADNVCVTLELAHSYTAEKIYERCFRFINGNAVDVLKASNFPDLCKECVDRVLTSDDLNADELEVYNALIRWADGSCARTRQCPTDKTCREVLGSLLFCVRFAIMDVDEFTHKLSMKDVLSLEEKVVLY
ncbi:BTBD6-like protein [Mya arenaria]|uniref:BTBD6-like protein n=1 Tax=Mya arenaria TaxID=6604 RepID=A0ABY7EDT5_MYAAR|nr:BTBD6-like protein [Mya arenaria]